MNLTKLAAFLLCMGMIVAFSANPAKAGDPYNDYAAIRAVIGLYIQAGKEAKSAIMKPAFHPNAIMYGTAGAEVSGGPIQGLFDYIDGNPKAMALETEIVSIDVAGNIANVRVESNNWNGARYSDMFLLLKDQTGWIIITKIYHDHK